MRKFLFFMFVFLPAAYAEGREGICYDTQFNEGRGRFFKLELHENEKAVLKTPQKEVLEGKYSSSVIEENTRTKGMTRYQINVSNKDSSISLELLGDAGIPQFGSGEAKSLFSLFSGGMLVSCINAHDLD